MSRRLCIAGKNNIAVNICAYILNNYKDVSLCVIFNENDNGQNGFQRSFKRFCQLNQVKEVTLDEIYQYDDLIFLSLEFDKIIKPHLFKSTRLYNIHFSYLPEFKGMYTSALPILKGKEYTGVTLHEIDKGIDTGSIIAQQKIGISNQLTCGDLYDLYIEEGTRLVLANIDTILQGNVVSKAQPIENSTYYSKASINFRELKIDLNNTAFSIQRQINAFVFPYYQLPKVAGYEIYKAQILDLKSQQRAGKIIEDTDFYLELSTIDFDIRLHKDLRMSLFDLARTGDIEGLKKLIDADYDIKQRSKEGWDIAIIAAYNNQFEFLEYLLQVLKWDINTKNNNGTTLAMYLMTAASQSSVVDYFDLFLQTQKVDLSVNDYSDCDIYYYAHKYNNPLVLNILNQ